MSRFIFPYLPFSLIAFCLGSCVSLRKIVYLQQSELEQPTQTISPGESVIVPNDNLYITVSALNADAVRIFNNPTIAYDANIGSEVLNVSGYLVDERGEINFPVLGRITLGGLTKNQAVKLLQERISEYIVDPRVNLRFLNYRVTVLGEVNRPGVYTSRDERVTLLDALGMAGDMTIYGKRNNILVYRASGDQTSFARLDITSPEILQSEYFFLQQNDVVYVQPNKTRAGTSGYNQNLTLGVSVLSLLVTVVALLL